MPAHRRSDRPYTLTPEARAFEAMENATTLLEAYKVYTWQWMIDSERDLEDGLENAEALQSFFEYLTDTGEG